MTTEVVTAKSEIIRLEKEEIEKIIPHREPMLLVDRVVSLMPGEFIVAEKTVTEEECRIQEKASKVGFDWDKKEKVWEKVKEEINEFEEISKTNDTQKTEEEFGDLLFSLVNYCRFVGINPENALRVTNEKFVKRFKYIEEKLKEANKKITDAELKEMDELWEQSKDKD